MTILGTQLEVEIVIGWSRDDQRGLKGHLPRDWKFAGAKHLRGNLGFRGYRGRSGTNLVGECIIGRLDRRGPLWD